MRKIVALAVLCLPSLPAIACVDPEFTLEQKFDQSYAVVAATAAIVATSDIDPALARRNDMLVYPTQTITWDAAEVWKGDSTLQAVFTTRQTLGSCDRAIAQGDAMLLFIRKDSDGSLWFGFPSTLIVNRLSWIPELYRLEAMQHGIQ